MRGLGDIGEVGGATSTKPLTLGIAGSEKEQEPDPKAEENGSLKLNPNPLTSFFFSLSSLSSCFSSPLSSSCLDTALSLIFPSILTPARSSVVLISHTNGLPIFTPLFRLLDVAAGVRSPALPCKGDTATSFLAEETNTGKGIRLGEGVSEHGFPGGAIHSGFGGEVGFGVAEGLRDEGFGGWGDCGVADSLRGEGDLGAAVHSQRVAVEMPSSCSGGTR
jgi:hypothetical protein